MSYLVRTVEIYATHANRGELDGGITADEMQEAAGKLEAKAGTRALRPV